MNELYPFTKKYHKKNELQENFNSSATQLDALLQELLSERQYTKEKDICSSSEKYGKVNFVESCGDEKASVNVPQLQKFYFGHEKVENNATEIRLANIKAESVEKNICQYSLSNDLSKDISSRNNTDINLMCLPLQKDLESSSLSSNLLPAPGTQVTTTIRTYTYELPAAKNVQSYFLYGSKDQVAGELTENKNTDFSRIINSTSTTNYSKSSAIESGETSVPIESILGKKNTTQEYEIYQKEEQCTLPFNHQYSIERDQNDSSWKYTFRSNMKIDSQHPNAKTCSSQTDSISPNISDNNFGLRKIDKPLSHETDVNDAEIRCRIKNVDKNSSLELSQQKIPSVNKVGPAVYYPPNKTSKNGLRTNYSMQGKYVNQSESYEYESSYKAKTKTSSGGALVPVCLPLCCAMPCSIM